MELDTNKKINLKSKIPFKLNIWKEKLLGNGLFVIEVYTNKGVFSKKIQKTR